MVHFNAQVIEENDDFVTYVLLLGLHFQVYTDAFFARNNDLVLKLDVFILLFHFKDFL